MFCRFEPLILCSLFRFHDSAAKGSLRLRLYIFCSAGRTHSRCVVSWEPTGFHSKQTHHRVAGCWFCPNGSAPCVWKIVRTLGRRGVNFFKWKRRRMRVRDPPPWGAKRCHGSGPAGPHGKRGHSPLLPSPSHTCLLVHRSGGRIVLLLSRARNASGTLPPPQLATLAVLNSPTS